jgi:heme/copper-type cytochrome/quinol oxidase subunit 2
MADTVDSTGEIQAHEQTWSGFKTMMTWGTVVVAIIVAGVVFLIAS